MESRLEFVMDVLSGECSFAEVCRHHGVTRSNGYKWWERFLAEGQDGLESRSRARLTSVAHKTAPELHQLIIAERQAHKHWGARKIRAVLQRNYPTIDWPAASTMGEIFKKEGLVVPRKRRQHTQPYDLPFLGCEAPNDTWCIDFKGQFPLRDGEFCYPLTTIDAFSRFILGCRAFPGIHFQTARDQMELLFREFGLPRAIRSDNGTPFSSALAICGLSLLSIWFTKLGIRHERIEPGKPQQNGRLERMHRTLKQETTHPAQESFAAQQQVFDDFKKEFNEVRPHEALQMRTPSSVYVPSPRPYPSKLMPLEYPSWNHLRVVDANGAILFKYQQVFLGRPLAKEVVGLEPINDGVWLVRFGSLTLGHINERDAKLSLHKFDPRPHY